MNFLSLEYFLAIVEAGSFSGAARKLFVSQQSLSEHMQKLEAELGGPLLKRGRPLSLTPAGEILHDAALEMLAIRHQALQGVAQAITKQRSKITIGIATFDTPPFLPALLAQFALRYPQYEAVVVKRPADDISHHLNGVDLYFSWLPLDPNLRHELLIAQDSFAVVVHERLLQQAFGDDWPTIEAKLRISEDLSLLESLPYILLYDRNGMLSGDLKHIFAHYDFSPAVGFQSENGDLNAEMCVGGAGAFLAPLDFCRRKFEAHFKCEDTPLRIYTIRTLELSCSLALSYEKGKTLHPAELAFIGLAREILSCG